MIQIIRTAAAGILLGILLIAPSRLRAQDHEHAEEIKAEVPALRIFHAVIYTLWHEAWPKKDTALLASLLSEIEEGAANVAGAKLPGILRDKQPTWSKGVADLKDIVKEYAAAVKKQDQQQLLDAAERLHAQYERLVRIIRPALKELDEFHAVLYMLYHHYVPDNNLSAIRTSADTLRLAVDALGKATLPARWKQKEEAFSLARGNLANSAEAFRRAVYSGKDEEIRSSLEVLHTDYQRLERIFE